MVVWELSSKGGPHPWNQGFAWEALRKWWCGRCLPRVGGTAGTKDFAWDALRKLVLGGLFWGWPRLWNHGFCLGGVEETGVWKSLLE